MNLPLRGRRILVTRPTAQAESLVRGIAERGGLPLRFPLLDIGPTPDPAPLQQAVAQRALYSLAIFVSANAVSFALPAFLAEGAWPDTLRVAAVGPQTAAHLVAAGFTGVIAPAHGADSEALLAHPALEPKGINGKHVLILRGNGGRELLADCLRERGAQVTCVPCYHRSPPADPARLLSWLRHDEIDALTLSSSEGLRHLIALLTPQDHRKLRDLPLFVSHPRIAQAAIAHNLPHVVLTGAADTGIIAGLCAFDWLHHE